jgi:hypothetical protein
MAALDQEIRRAQEAELLMSNPMLREALETIRKTLNSELLRADLNNPDRLKTLVMHTQVVNSFEKLLKTTMETGKLARIQKETLAQQARSILRKVTG